MLSKKVAKIVLLLAAIFSIGFMVGGEYLHEAIHSHASQESHDQCPVHVLQSQPVAALASVVLLAAFVPGRFVLQSRDISIAKAVRSLPPSRAPPGGLFLLQF